VSNIFVENIIGNVTYAVPTTDAELAAATAGLDTHIDNIANLDYARVIAWVGTADGVGAFRTLNCLIEEFEYNGEECPDAAETVTLTAAISAELVGDANITSIGDQQVHIFQAGSYFLWSRDSAGAYVYPTTATDDVAVGAGPNGVWFNDGDLVTGAAAMDGVEKLRVVGVSYLQGDVGIFDGTPSYPLDCTGNFRLTGAGVVGGTDAVSTATRLLATVNSYASGGTLYGIYVDLDVTDDADLVVGVDYVNSIANTKTITVGYGLNVADPLGAGTITNNYGLYIVDQNSGASTITNSYGLYQEGTTDWNVFQGNVAVGGPVDTDSMVYVEDDRTTTAATQGIRAILDYHLGSTKSSFKAVEVDVDVGNASGEVTDCYDIYLDSPTGAGTITNIYGVYIDECKCGPASGATLAYGIYQAGPNDDNYFAGAVGLNETGPSYEVDADGDINVQVGQVYRHKGAAGDNSGATPVYNDGTPGNITSITFSGGIVIGVVTAP
jgi:hypothetical protein